jgi:hypothetical protein
VESILTSRSTSAKSTGNGVTDIALEPAECPKPTSLWPLRYDDFTKDAIAAAHSAIADVDMRKVTRGFVIGLTNVPWRAVLECSLVDYSGIPMIQPVETPSLTYTIWLLRVLVREQIPKHRFPMLLVCTIHGSQPHMHLRKHQLTDARPLHAQTEVSVLEGLKRGYDIVWRSSSVQANHGVEAYQAQTARI